MSEEKHNPKYITIELCNAMMAAHKDAMAANLKYLEEKIKGIERTIAVGFSISTALMMAFQFYLSL